MVSSPLFYRKNAQMYSFSEICSRFEGGVTWEVRSNWPRFEAQAHEGTIFSDGLCLQTHLLN